MKSHGKYFARNSGKVPELAKVGKMGSENELSICSVIGRLKIVWNKNERGRAMAQKTKTPAGRETCEAWNFLAPRPGLEPGTYGLTVRRSTN